MWCVMFKITLGLICKLVSTFHSWKVNTSWHHLPGSGRFSCTIFSILRTCVCVDLVCQVKIHFVGKWGFEKDYILNPNSCINQLNERKIFFEGQLWPTICGVDWRLLPTVGWPLLSIRLLVGRVPLKKQGSFLWPTHLNLAVSVYKKTMYQKSDFYLKNWPSIGLWFWGFIRRNRP